jgi:hypothetical protein
VLVARLVGPRPVVGLGVRGNVEVLVAMIESVRSFYESQCDERRGAFHSDGPSKGI